jgi:F0F1-type ATP synthase assembly protein I
VKLFTRSFLIWIVGSCLLVLILSLLFAHAPQPLKRLGLSYAIFGILCGAVLGWFAKDRKLSFTKGLAFSSVLIVFAGGGHISWVSYQQFKAVRAKQLQEDPKQLAMLNMMEKMADETTATELQERRRGLQPQFLDYLTFRVSSFGKWSSPWPLIFWLGELLLASILAVWVVLRSVNQDRENHPLQSQNEKQAS